PLLHDRLIVVQVHLRRSTDHVQIDDVLDLSREVRGHGSGMHWIGAGSISASGQQRGQGRPSEQVRSLREEVPAGDVLFEFLKCHRTCLHSSFATVFVSRELSRSAPAPECPARKGYLFSTSSRFMSWLAT